VGEGLLCPYSWGRAGSPSKAMSSGLRPTSVLKAHFGVIPGAKVLAHPFFLRYTGSKSLPFCVTRCATKTHRDSRFANRHIPVSVGGMITEWRLFCLFTNGVCRRKVKNCVLSILNRRMCHEFCAYFFVVHW